MKNTLQFLVSSKVENLNSVRFYLLDFEISDGVVTSYTLTQNKYRAVDVNDLNIREILISEISSEDSDGESVRLSPIEIIEHLAS